MTECRTIIVVISFFGVNEYRWKPVIGVLSDGITRRVRLNLREGWKAVRGDSAFFYENFIIILN